MIQQGLYNLSIHLYTLIIRLLAPFDKKAKLWVEGRVESNKKLTVKSILSENNRKSIWFHCASLGEFEQGRPVIEAFRKEFPDYKIVLTFFSPSGFEIRKNYDGADLVCYLPADTPKNAQKFINLINPSIVFFVKYEFWRNYISELKKRQIPIFSFSTIFRKNQIFFKPYGGFFRKILLDFDHIFVQNQESGKLLQSIDYKQFTVAGDTRFDRVKQIVDNVKEIEIVKRFGFGFAQPQFDAAQQTNKKNNKIFIVGSAWQEDIDCIFPKNMNPNFATHNSQNLSLIIAPHEIHESQILAWQKQILMKNIRFSEINKTTQLSDYQCLIIDNIGMLSSLYQYADFAFIGGGFGKGLHNILEAATFGMPIFFGNKAFQKFKEATDLVELGGAFAIENATDFQLKFRELSENEEKRLAMAKICRNYVLENIGATEKVMSKVRNLLTFNPNKGI